MAKRKRFQKKQFTATITKQVSAPYLLYVPPEYDDQAGRSWPFILFLHGAGQCGEDLVHVRDEGLPQFIARTPGFPFVVAAPQCPCGEWWDIDMLSALMTTLLEHLNIDKTRLYLTGLSLGGMGTWDLAARHPDWFAAIAPICGPVDAANAPKLKHIPIWVFHGEQDPHVPIAESIDMVEALQREGADVRFTIYPDGGHNVWDDTYSDPELYEWFLSHNSSFAR